MKKKISFNFSNRVILKPWGEEYVIFNNKKKLAITYLKIKKNSSTSLHCHPKKKTGFLILKGTAEVQVGIYKENIKKYKPLSILVLRPGLFHKIKASKNSDLYALEVENPYIKSDLVRMQDNYGRKEKGYESLEYSRKLNDQDILFKHPKKKENKFYKLNGVKINISYTENFKNLKSLDNKSVLIILDGKIVSKKNKTIITFGEIIKSLTLKKLLDYFKIEKKLLILKASLN